MNLFVVVKKKVVIRIKNLEDKQGIISFVKIFFEVDSHLALIIKNFELL